MRLTVVFIGANVAVSQCLTSIQTQVCKQEFVTSMQTQVRKKPTSLVLTYHLQIKFVTQVAERPQPIIKSDPQLHLFPVSPLIAYGQPPNFKRILTSKKTLNLTLVLFPAILPNASVTNKEICLVRIVFIFV